jgi:hypothetical protein
MRSVSENREIEGTALLSTSCSARNESTPFQ